MLVFSRVVVTSRVIERKSTRMLTLRICGSRRFRDRGERLSLSFAFDIFMDCTFHVNRFWISPSDWASTLRANKTIDIPCSMAAITRSYWTLTSSRMTEYSRLNRLFASCAIVEAGGRRGGSGSQRVWFEEGMGWWQPYSAAVLKDIAAVIGNRKIRDSWGRRVRDDGVRYRETGRLNRQWRAHTRVASLHSSEQRWSTSGRWKTTQYNSETMTRQLHRPEKMLNVVARLWSTHSGVSIVGICRQQRSLQCMISNCILIIFTLYKVWWVTGGEIWRENGKL